MRYAEFAPYCDILPVVPYVVTKMEPLNEGDFSRIHQSVLLAKRVMKGKPVYAVIQSFAGHPHWPRLPTPSELLSMVAVTQAAGTDGYAFYAYVSGERFPAPTSPHGFRLCSPSAEKDRDGDHVPNRVDEEPDDYRYDEDENSAHDLADSRSAEDTCE